MGEDEGRYELVKEIGDTWAVFDAMSGLPVTIGEVALAGLSIEEAVRHLWRLRRNQRSNNTAP